MDNESKYQEPSRETRVRIEGKKDTARGDGSAHHVQPPWKLGDRLNDFVLEKFLGKGTSGFVYRALDTLTQRRCALKLLLPGTPEDLVRNKLGFRRMMSIEHPSLLRVGRIHQLGSYIAMSMEEVQGDTLPRAVRKLRQVDMRSAYQQLLQLTRQYAAGLAAMHVNGYVHRDVKPQNLMVDLAGNGRVIDYGLVGTFDPETDPYGYRHYLAGTPHYFSPEILWDQHYLPAGDVFALGMVMLESLHSISWHAGQEQSEIQRSETDRHADAAGISEAIEGLDESVPEDLRSICLEMLQRDPGKRPTAMRVARFGLSTATPVAWPQENPLVGRQREVAEITSWLEEIYAGEVGRLHLTGPSGIGKTRLIDDIEKCIRRMRWGQVFRARCCSRENQPLQAFDQICDKIANRYKQGDRELLELDPISATILHTVFPTLKNIVHCNMQLVPAETTTERLDALEAAARMSQALREVGPLILIIDDAQWADRDSLNVLDRLQTATGDIGLGIITVSRESADPQRIPATRTIDLQPLGTSDSIAMLAEAADRSRVDISETVLLELSEAAAGSPFLLHELADEFRPGGALSRIVETSESDTSVSRLGQIDLLWQKRVARLSEDANRVLALVVTAGQRVSTQQLGDLTELGDAVDAAVSELAQQRLISDDATGGLCIQVVHDKVAEGLLKTLDEPVKIKAHHAWAVYLSRQDRPEEYAARIAGHFFAAQEPGRAVSHAVLAAEDAERLVALTEAARWHAKVVDHVEGPEKIARLRHAARCYYEADHPIEAAEFYKKLAKHVDVDERIECQLLAASLSIRGGQFSQVRSQLQDLARSLGLPRPKRPLWSKFALGVKTLQVAWQDLFRDPSKAVLAAPSTDETDSQQSEVSLRDKQRLKLCVSLARPMSMFDNLYSAELNLTGMQLAFRYGTEAQRIHSIIGRAVFGCYDKGAKRTVSEMQLQDLRTHVQGLQNSRASADLWAGVAYSHALSCRWNEVSDAVAFSIENYHCVADSSGFEIAHTQWLDLWACWNLGRWDLLFQISDVMFDDAIRRNDSFQRLVVTNGIGCSAWLARDRTVELDRIRLEDRPLLADTSMQMFHVFGWIASVQQLIYEGKFDDAWKEWQSLQPLLNKLPYSRLQLIRVVRHSLGALISLHHLGRGELALWAWRVRKLVGRLRREQLPYARVLANLYDGLLHQRLAASGNENAEETALILLRAARQEAKTLRLRPFQLAADDAMSQIETGRCLGLLRERMDVRGVERPMLLERLYSARPVATKTR